MNNKLIFFIIKKYLKFDKTQPFISISAILAFLGVSIGIMVLIIAMSLMNGMSKEFEKRLFSMNYPLTIYPKFMDAVDQTLLTKLENEFPNLIFSPFVKSQAIVKSGDEMSGGIVFGVNFDKEIQVNEVIKDSYKNEIGKYGIILGSGMSEELFVEKNQKVTLIFTNSTVGGVGLIPSMKRFKVESEFKSGLMAYDKTFMYAKMEDLQKILKRDKDIYSGIHIYSKEPFKDIEKIKNSIPSNTVVVGWWEQNGNFFSAQQMEKQALFIVLMLIILIASLNIISSLLMTIMSRRKEIALLLSLGMSKKEIKKLFFYLGVIIGGTGIICGIGLGFFGIYILENTNLITIPADVYGTATLPFDLLVSDFISILIGGVFIVLISSFYPAHKASKIDIIKTLKYE
jgi:putative ABC transport system permease protein